MKITSIEVIRENLTLKRPYTIAYKTVSAVENCFVVVHAENGMQGMGAANPSSQVVGEDVAETEALLGEAHLAQFIGRDIRELPGLLQELHEKYPRNPGAKAALDIAFYDLFAQYLGIPLLSFLGQKIKRLPTSITIGIKNVEETLIEAQEYVDRGFKILKVKLGHNVEEDIERIAKIREKHGKALGIRVDANQGYSAAELLAFWKASQDFQLELIEQPLSVADSAQLASLPQELLKQLAADESLVSANDAYTLSKSALFGIFNIKLMKCGGVFQAIRIAELAQYAGIDLMWGCNDESIISITAALHAAFSCAHTKYIDLDGSLDLAKDKVAGGFKIEEGWMYPLDAPGLGLQRL